MAMYYYVKASPMAVHPPRRRSLVSLFLMTVGAGMLLWIVWPILSFSILNSSLLTKTVAPVGDSSVAFAATPPPGAVTAVDYTNANVWYPTAPQKDVVTPVNTYTLSIPKLKIQDALVTIGGDDLNTSLVHYGGTGLPGQYGTAVVFGHSMLPQFFSPTNYKSIFSLLPTLKPGDDILVTYDGVQYRYVIVEMLVVDPTDLSVLEQRFDDSYITLVTCVPPGTYWKRLNVKAKLQTL